MEEIKIEPMSYHGPGACPDCFIPLIVCDRDLTVMDLDKHGNVVNIFETHNECSALCPKCGKKYKMMRCNGIYRPYSETMMIFAMIDREEEKEKRAKGSYQIKGNPLAL